jgi:ribokinase
MRARQARIVVVGSINMDLVAKLDRSPIPGETIMGSHFAMIPGGKGANQAVAAARLGAKVSMIGCVGDDVFGAQMKQQLQREGIDTSYVYTAAAQSTGVALIQVQREGDNSIIVVAGANASLTPELVDSAEDVIRSADVMLLQLEIPLYVVERAIEHASRHGVRVVLNPAPAPAGKLPEQMLSKVDVLTPNETEASILTTGTVQSDGDSWKSLYALKQAAGVPNVLVTHGAEGVYFDLDGVSGVQEACKVAVVDTTGAGDCFNAATAVRWGEGASLQEAISFAVRAAALAVTKFGAQTSLPTRDEVEQFGS